MSAYAGPWRVVSAEPVPAPLLALARKLVGGLIEVGGIPQRQWNLPDGSTIHVLLVAGVPKVTITQPQGAPATAAALFKVWLPRGFVAVPASSSYPRGAGLPVVPSTEQPDPYAKANLEPGLDMARWTAGGPHGQVLLSTDADGGFPTAIAQGVPLYCGTLGPTDPQGAGFDSRATGAVWHAFRPRYADFVQHYDGDPAGPRRALFAALNAYRDTNAVAAAYLMPRGFYRPAEVLSYLLTANGTSQASYPAGYRSIDQRLLKDGPWTDAAAGYNELVATGGAPGDVLTAWQASHAAALLLQPADAPVFADVGFSGGQWALTTQVREQWIMAGRRAFQSADPALPPISWDGPGARNIGWLTWPIRYWNHTVYSPLSLFDSSGAFYASDYSSTYGKRPLLSGQVYCRGRVLGTLPAGGLVLGAAIATLTKIEAQATVKVDRLLVIAHQPADNAGLDSASQGLTPVAHVWYADFPHDQSLRLHAEQPVTTWQDAGTLAVPGTRYLSLWEFNADGSKAVCLRDLLNAGDVADQIQATYQSVLDTGSNTWFFSIEGLTDLGADTQLVEVAISDAPGLTLTSSALACNSAGRVQDNTLPLMSAAYPLFDGASVVPIIHSTVAAQAAAYDASGAVRIAYTALATALFTARDADAFPTRKPVWYRYAGVGDASAVYERDLQQLVLIGGSFAVAEIDLTPASVQVLDVASGTFAVSGARAQLALDYASYDYGTGFITFGTNAAYPSCLLDTSDAVHWVRLYRAGALVDESGYGHPYGVLWHYPAMFLYVPPPALAIDNGSDLLVHLPAVVGQFVQPFHAQRGGETIYGYQVGLNAPLTATDVGSCQPLATDYVAAVNAGTNLSVSAEDRPVVGGKTWATFALPDTGGSWLHDLKVV